MNPVPNAGHAASHNSARPSGHALGAVQATGTLNGAPVPRRSLMRPCLLLAIPFFLLCALARTNDEQAGYMSIVVALVLYGAMTIMVPRSLLFGLVDIRLGPWIVGYAALTFGLSTLTVVAGAADPRSRIDHSQLTGNLILVGASYALFALAYKFGGRPNTSSPAKQHGALTAPRTVIAYTSGITALAISVLTSGRLGYLGDVSSDTSALSWYTQPLVMVSDIRICALGCATYMAFMTRQNSWRVIMFACFAIEIPIAGISGTKSGFIILGLAVILPYMLARRRIPRTFSLVCVVVLLVVVFPLVGVIRSAASSEGQRVSISETITRLVDPHLSRTATGGTLADQLLNATARFGLIGNVNVIQGITPKVIPYHDPLELVYAPAIGLIPRAIWPDKPVRLAGNTFYHLYWGGQGYSFSAITFPGSLLLYGPPVWMLLAMIIFGLFIRRFDDWKSHLPDGLSLISVLVFFPILVKQEADLAGVLQSLPILILTYLGAQWLLISRAPTSRGPELSKGFADRTSLPAPY